MAFYKLHYLLTYLVWWEADVLRLLISIRQRAPRIITFHEMIGGNAKMCRCKNAEIETTLDADVA